MKKLPPPTASEYLRLLEPWMRAAEQWEYRPPDRPELLCYGPGYNGWGVQTHQKALAAFAVLATDPGLDESRTGAGREELLAKSRAMLRFSLESHLAGGYHCTDGTRWGHTWISALGIERMMHGVEALRPHLSAGDEMLLATVLASECDWLTDEYPVEAGPIQHNKPESNLWNGALLHRTALLYPDHLRAAEWRDKGTRFLLNGISVPEDATSATLYEGRPLSEWHVGENFFPSYSLNHHGYLNVGYMVICLSQVAMLHLACQSAGLIAPEALYHHAQDLWHLVKHCHFADGRLLRIGGDTRVRYCYCQDYAIPVWLMASQLWEDEHAAAFEAGWLKQVGRECNANGDNSFLSERCAELATASPLYYTRLESDRAASLSMGAYWRRRLEVPDTVNPLPAKEFAWSDDYHGAVFQRGLRRVASWCWLAAEKPQGLCLPTAGSDLAEWKEHLTGRVMGQGRTDDRTLLSHTEQPFEGGFLTWGEVSCRSGPMLAEGQPAEETARIHLVATALPDDATLLVLQRAVTSARRIYLTESAGIGWLIPNDLFNDGQRTYFSKGGQRMLQGIGAQEETWRTDSLWLNVENRLGLAALYGVEKLELHRPGRRQIGLRATKGQDPWEGGGMLWADEVWACRQVGLQAYDPETVLFDLGFALRAGASGEETALLVKQGQRLLASEALRVVSLPGADGVPYVLAANFGQQEAGFSLDTELTDLSTNEQLLPAAQVIVPAGEARVFRLAPR